MKYKIIKPIVLGFLTPNDSYDALLDEGTLEVINGDIVFTCVAGNTATSHTMTSAINIWLKQGRIQYV